MKRILNLSGRLGANLIDWIRGIYYSLILNLVTLTLSKLLTLSWRVLVCFGVSCLLTLVGLIFSAKITNRFKNYEKDYDKYKINKNVIKLRHYYAKRDRDFGAQHMTVYTMLILSLLFYGVGFFVSDSQSASQKSAIMDKQRQADSLQTVVNECRFTSSKQLQQISFLNDSLAKLTKRQTTGKTAFKPATQNPPK